MLLVTKKAPCTLVRLWALTAGVALPLATLAQTIISFTPATGPAGTLITITGTGLGSAKSVLLNGQSLTLGTGTGNTLQVTVPVAASTGKLVLTTSAGSVVSATQFGVTRSTSGTTFPQQTAKGSSFNGMRVAAASNSAVTNSYGAASYSTPTIADLTNTGRTDLLVGNANGNIEYWKQGAVGSMAFSKQGNLQVGGADIRVANFAKPTVVDLDGDGLLDLLVGTGDDKRVARFEQTAAGATTFTSLGNLKLTSGADLSTGNNFPRPAVTDLDGDGRLDLLIGDYSGLMKRYEASAVNAATFVADAGNVQADGATLKADGTSANGTAKPLIFDMDGNGLLDMVMGTQLGAIVRYEQSARYALTFTNKGNLTTNGTTAISMGASGNNEGGFSAPIITDIDKDGRLDMFIGNADGSVYLYTQAQQAALTTSPLPVVLTAFTGQATSAGSQLSWATATEQNSRSFEIERSADGNTFAQLGSVAAAGTSTTAHAYQYLDAAAPAGISYYRLRQVDLDGTVAYSPVVALTATRLAVAAQALAYPSPFAETLSVALPGTAASQPATITLLTLDGRQVYSRALALGATPQALADLPALAPGLYVLRTTTAAGTTAQRLSHN